MSSSRPEVHPQGLLLARAATPIFLHHYYGRVGGCSHSETLGFVRPPPPLQTGPPTAEASPMATK